MAILPQAGLYAFQSFPSGGGTTKPIYSPSGGNIYYLPPVNGNDARVMHLNKSGTAVVDLEHNVGSFPNMGTSMAFPTNAEITAMFDFLPPWYSPSPGIDQNIYNQNKGYGTGLLGLENAIYDFWQKVVEVGMGILVDNLPQGHRFSYRYTSAVLASDITTTRMPGARIQVEITFNCPSGIWTFSDGTTKAHIY